MNQCNPPELRDKNGQIIREFDIVRVFHFYGRKRGKGHERNYMYKIANIKDTKDGPQWWFWHTAEMKEGYFPKYAGSGILKEAEIIDSPLGLKEWVDIHCPEIK